MGGRVDGAEAAWPCCVEHARAESRANSCKSPRSPRLRQTTPKRRPRRTCHWFLERRLAVRLRQGYGGQPSRGLPTVAHGLVGKCERRLVRKRGFEPLRSCERQPLKLVRLPVPPLPRSEGRFCFACDAICAGASASSTSFEWLAVMS